MKKGLSRGVLIGLAATLAVPSLAAAQTLQERVAALEKKIDAKSVAEALGVDIHGMVAVDYMYDTNSPDHQDTNLRVFDGKSNSFTLNQANLRFSRQREKEDFGFVVNMDFGETAEVVGMATDWDSDSESSNSFELREAYLTYKIPFGEEVVLKAGKMVTLHGAEVIKEYNNFNPTVSNSFLFGYSIPFTHTGLMLSFPMGEYFAADLGLVNGWDNVVDNNNGKSFHGGFKIIPSEQFNIYLSGTYGPEQNERGDSKRALAAMLVTLNATDQLTFILDANYGNETEVLPERGSGTGERAADWYGVAGYVIFKPTDDLSLAVRAEGFDDSDGWRTGTAPGTTFWEITPSVSYKLTEKITARFEYRHDEANHDVFNDGDHLQNGRNTVATELIFAM